MYFLFIFVDVHEGAQFTRFSKQNKLFLKKTLFEKYAGPSDSDGDACYAVSNRKWIKRVLKYTSS